MTFTISEIREALKAQLEANLSRETNVSVRGEERPPPCIYLYPSTGDYITYDQTFGNVAIDVELELRIATAGADMESVTIRLDDYLSAGTGNNSSIVDAINTDATLGGVVESCRAVSARVDRETGEGFLTVAVMGARS